MRFENMTNNQAITEAAKKAEALLLWGSVMLNDVQSKHDWKWDKDCLSPVLTLSMRSTKTKIFTYRPWNPFTKAIAMTKGDGAIHFNIYKVDKTTLAEKVGTILHEYAHICGFTHGSNYRTKEKDQFSVPYYLSSNAEKWL